MVDIVEILNHWYSGRSQAAVARSLGVDRRTVKKYYILCSQRKKCSRHEDGYFVDMSLTHRPRGPNAWFRPRPGAVREPVPADRGAVDFPAGDG